MTSVDVLLKPSALAHRVLFWCHVLPLALLPFSMEPGPIMLLVAAVMAGSWVALRRHPAFGFGPTAIRRVRAAPDENRWQVDNAAGTIFPAVLEDSSSVFSGILLLNFRVGETGKRRSRMVFGDEADGESIRSLRVRLGEQRSSTESSNGAA